jgi:uncharacterized protein CbrC (UPF0167 family)
MHKVSGHFRYFEHPHSFSSYQLEPETCGICGHQRAGYRCVFHGPKAPFDFVCEDCLASGRLAEHDLSTNAADRAALEQQLRQLRPPLDGTALQTQVQACTAEVEQRTPPVVTWQYFQWPAHCGDYCRFVQEVGKRDLNRLAANRDGLAFFATHTREIQDLAHAQEVWPYIRPDSPRDGKNAYDVAVYFFDCLKCGQPVMLWDCS